MPKRADPGAVTTYYVTDDQKKRVRDAIDKGVTSAAKLAKISGVSRQAIYLLIDGDTRTITYWPAIAREIGDDSAKAASAHDARLQEIIRRWPELSDDDRALVEATARRLSRKP